MKFKSSILLFQRLNQYVFKGSTYHSHQSIFVSLQRRFSDWHVVGALCLERKPIITQEMSPLERRYFNYLDKVEKENSYLSDHEKRHLEDVKTAEKIKTGDVDDNIVDSALKQTAQDFEDASVEELNKFNPNPRITEADIKNDQCSIQRKLCSSLVFVIKQKIGNDHRWVLPQAVNKEGETLRQTAERAFHSVILNPVKIQMMGNAPVGYYKYKYPKVVRGDGVCGAKVFFFKAQLLDNKLDYIDLKQTEDVLDHAWLTHSELEKFLQPVYEKAVQSFLYPVTLDIKDNTSKSCSSEDDEHIEKTSASN